MAEQDVGRVDSEIDRSGSLNFKVNSEFKRAFKAYAASQGLTMVDLLKEGFTLSQAASRE